MIRNILCTLLSAAAIASADIVLDDFTNFFGGANEQTNLGEARGYAEFSDTAVDKGAGYWVPFADEWGSKVTTGSGTTIGDDNAGDMVDSIGHTMSFKLVCSTADSTGKLYPEGYYPYAGVGTEFKDSITYVDFSTVGMDFGMRFVVRGKGTVRVSLETRDIDSLGFGWGNYGYAMTLTDTVNFKTVNITADKFVIDPNFSIMLDDTTEDAAKTAIVKGWDLSHAWNAIKGFKIEAVDAIDASLEIDSVIILGATASTFSFAYPSVGIGASSSALQQGLGLQAALVGGALNLSYRLPSASNVVVGLYTASGKLLRQVSRTATAGINTDKLGLAADMASGVYMVKLTAGDRVVTTSVNLTR